MDIHLLTAPADLEAYDAWIATHPHGTLWQSRVWRRFQEHLGRTVRTYVLTHEGNILASAQVVIDQTVMNLSTWDIPRGPLFGEGLAEHARGAFMNHLIQEARAGRCMAFYCSPLVAVTHKRLDPSPRHEQPEATRIIDLTQPDEGILAKMHQKGRYNIKVAEKNAVRVERSDDAAAFAKLLTDTAHRDGFAAAPARHYEAFLKHVEGAFLLLAYESDELRAVSYEHAGIEAGSKLKSHSSKPPIAGLMGVIWGTTAIYYYGASDYAHRSLMAPYLLQWEAMRYAKERGCSLYDLLGVAPPDAPEDHAWQGISRFKEKFGGDLVAYPPEQCAILRRAAYLALRTKRSLLG
jgi:peptidoglycan pentaglycine glycine transferase (the first glycine)